MKTDTDVLRKLTLIVMIFSVGTIGLSSIAPAMAMTPGLIAADVVESATAGLAFDTVPAATEADAIGVYTSAVAVISNGCFGSGPGGLPAVPGGETGWVLLDSNDAIAQIDVVGMGVVVNTPFGAGVTFTPAGVGITSFDGPFYWNEIGTTADGVPNDTTNVGGNTPEERSYVVCGSDGVDFMNLGGFGTGDSWNIVAPVAGELISINTSALLIAGLQANAFSLLAGLTGIGGAAFGLLYLQTKKTQQLITSFYFL